MFHNCRTWSKEFPGSKRSFIKKEKTWCSADVLLQALRLRKGQEMGMLLPGTLNEKVAAYMHDLDVELWKLAFRQK